MQIFRPTKFTQLGYTRARINYVYTLPRIFYGGGKSQQSTSQVSIPPEVLAQYSNVNSIANQVAQTPFTQYSTDPNAFVAPLTPTQQAGVLGTNQYSNTAQPYYQQAATQNQAATSGAQASTQAAGSPVTASQIQNYESPYNQNVIKQTSDLMNQQFQTAQSGQLGNAIQNGAFGGDRSAVAAANLQQQQGLAYGNTIAGLENQNYAQALGEANTQQQVGLQAANQYGQLGQAGAQNEANFGSGAQAAGLAGAQAQLTAGQAQQQTEQAGETALYNQFLQQQSYPFQTTQFQSNIAEGTGALSGSTTTSNQPAPYFSDERLKDDIEPIGKTFDGLNIIKFKYKGDKQTHVGLSAQDVEKKHPHAVGLAGGYKTVDYDAATKDAASKGNSEGGLVSSIGTGRHHFAGGGLAPNSAAEAGFLLDPSYLQAQQAAYGNAPWGNAGPVTGSSPYGGKSHVPPSTGGGHAQLSVAKAPSPSNDSGLKQLSQGVGQLEGLGKEGKSLYNDAKKYVPGLAGGNPPPPPQAAGLGIGTGQQGAPPPSKAQPVEANPDPNAGRATAGQLATNDNLGLGAQVADNSDFSGMDDGLGSLFSKRGGRIARDAGGTTYQDAASDDESGGGDVPYDSGTGAHGLDIPDDKPNNHLATAGTGSGNGSDSGLGGALGTAASIGKDILGFIPFLNRGGRVGLAAGGDPGDIPIPPMDDAASIQPSPPASDRAKGLAALAAQLPAPPVKARQVRPQAGLNPDAPSPDAQPVQMVRGRSGARGVVAPDDQDSINAGAAELPQPGQTQSQIVPGQVLRQDDPGGVASFLNRNQGLLVPALHGLGTMASSNSRYLGSAILQGLGGAADSYEATQDDMSNRGLVGTNMGLQGANAGLVNQEAARAAAEAKLVGAKTTGANISNTQQAWQQTPFGYVVWLADGTPILARDYKPGMPTMASPPPDAAARLQKTFQPAHAAPQQSTAAPSSHPPIVGQPESGGPAPAMPPGVNYDATSRAIAQKEPSVVFTGNVANAVDRTNKYRDMVTGSASDARDARPYYDDMAKTFVDAAHSGATGAYGPERAALTKTMNYMASTLGAGDNYFGNTPSDADILNKIATLQGGAQASSVHQSSYAALASMANALPNMEKTPEAGYNVTSQLMVRRQQALDAEQHMLAYQKDSNGSLMAAAPDFARANPPGKYNQEAAIIQDMMKNHPNQFKGMVDGAGTPHQMEEYLQHTYGKQYRPGISRYFTSYGQQ